MQTIGEAVEVEEASVPQQHCAKHDQSYPAQTFVAGQFRANRCPQCVIEETHEQAKREQVQRQKLQAEKDAKAKRDELEERLQRSLIPDRFATYSLDGFPAPPLAADAESLRVVLAACRSYVNTWPQKRKAGSGLVFVGPNGRGKTGLACGIANAVMRDYNATALFMTVRGVIRHQADTWGRKGKTEQQALDELVSVDLLIIDEAGVQAGTDTEMVLLTEAISGRHAYQRPTFLISNLAIGDFTLRGDPPDAPKRRGLRSLLGSRIWSRFEDDGTQVLTCNWSSLRLQSNA